MNVLALALYLAVTIALYLYFRYRLLREMVERQVVTVVSSKELQHLINYVFISMIIVGVIVGIISSSALAFLLIASILIIPVVLHEIIRNLIAYYQLVVSRALNVGEFVILTRGIRGWVKRITPFFVELRGEHEEVIRVPNPLVSSEPIRIPSKSLPFTLQIRVGIKHGVELAEIEDIVMSAVMATKRYSVIEPKVKIRSITNSYIEYEVMYGLGNYEVTSTIIKTLALKLRKALEEKGLSFEVKVEHALMSR